jgi:hypothetical protein
MFWCWFVFSNEIASIAKKLNRFWILMRITFESEIAGCTAVRICTGGSLGQGPSETSGFPKKC